MNTHRLTSRLQSLPGPPSRRDVLRGLAATGLGLAFARRQGLSEAKRHKHRKKKKIKRNGFGCVNVGGYCKNSGQCCSGNCAGKQGKRKCVAHDTAGICFPDNDSCTIGQGVACNLDNDRCLCVLTTGNAGFCGDFGVTGGADAICRDCSRDTDCQDEFGPGAACVFLGGVCSVSCANTGRTACIRPCPEEAP